jgi:hypothetical protein
VVWTNSGGPAAAYQVYRSTNLLGVNPAGGWNLLGQTNGVLWVDTNRVNAGGAAFYRILAP